MEGSVPDPSTTLVSACAAGRTGSRVAVPREAVQTHADSIASAAGRYRRTALWAEPSVETIIAIAGLWQARTTIVPISPALGSRELAHVLDTSRPDAVAAPAGVALPAPLEGLPRMVVECVNAAEGTSASVRVTLSNHAASPRGEDARDDQPALILFTSGTTGPPKGAMLSSAAIVANLDGLREAWRWKSDDVLVHALPLFHVHGLVLGVLGPLRIGSGLVHVGRFSPYDVGAALAGGGTMLFGVPTMYHRLAEAAERDPPLAAALAKARLLVSGSAPLAARDRERLQAVTGRAVIERYGLTETLIVCATPVGRDRPGTVGPAVPGVELRLVDDRGAVIDAPDMPGEIEVRGPCLFDGYLDMPDATARAVVNGWFRTGDTAARTPEGDYRIVGRTTLDIIKTGGYKVGAGEVEDVLRRHPDVGDAAVAGEPDADLGQRIVAWIEAAPGATPEPEALAAYVAGELAPYKRPRAVHVLERLPRTALGKVEKHRLVTRSEAADRTPLA